MSTRFDIQWCTNCDKRPVRTAGLCQACYKYRQIHGMQRPARYWPKAREVAFCECGGIAKQSGKCWACATYERKHGRPRPNRLINRPTTCITCGRQLTPCDRRHGECGTCFSYRKYYRRYHGIDFARPPHLWGCDPALGWCECGRPAVGRQTVHVPGGHDFSMGYCAECLEAA